MRLVRAEETVAAKIPAVTIGPQPDTMAITWSIWIEDMWTLCGGELSVCLVCGHAA